LADQVNPLSSTETAGKNGTGLGEIKKGVANNAPKAACPTCPLTTQHTILQDVRALANGHCKNTSFFLIRNLFIEKILPFCQSLPFGKAFAMSGAHLF
jgi:hypothetical protein